jgi:hypothetical protein
MMDEGDEDGRWMWMMRLMRMEDGCGRDERRGHDVEGDDGRWMMDVECN